MIKYKVFIFFGVFAIISMFFLSVHGASVRLVINNQEISGLPAPPVVRDDSVLVPARAVFEHMGGIVHWSSVTRQVRVYHDNDILVMSIGSRDALLNGTLLQMPTAPIIVSDSTLIPLRFPATVFGFDVYWDSRGRTAIVNTPEALPLLPGALPTQPPVNLPNIEIPQIGGSGGAPPITLSPIIAGRASANNAPPVIDTPPPQITEPQAPPSLVPDPIPTEPNLPPVLDEAPPITLPPISQPNLLPDPHPGDYSSSNQPASPILEVPAYDNDPVVSPPATNINGNLARNVSTTPIVHANHPLTNILQVLTPQDVGVGAYIVTASSAISDVTYFVLGDNRLVLDIHNAANMVYGDILVHHSVPISGARINQFSNQPMVTRVVFDVTQAAEFTLSLSSDRRSLTISFTANRISGVNLSTIGNMDTFTIVGDVLPYARLCTEGFPNYFTLNIDNAQMLASNGNGNALGGFVREFVTGQRSDNSVYVRVYVNSWPTINFGTAQNNLTVTMSQDITGVRYDSIRRELHISRTTGFTMDVNQVRQVDDYLSRRYSIILPNAATMLGRGEIGIWDGLVNSVVLDQDSSGNARLVFNTTRPLAFVITETAESYVIRVTTPRETHPFIVVLDPGHGGRNIGSAHHGIVERHLVVDIANKVMELLENNPNIRAYMTRHDDSHVYNYRRAEFANELGADLFVAIHFNAAGTVANPNPVPHGIETWYNIGVRESSSFNRFNSRQFAEIAQRHLINRTNAVCRGERYGANMIVLRESNMPAVLLELGFLTNPAEAARIATTSHQWQLAHAIHDSIVEAATRWPRF